LKKTILNNYSHNFNFRTKNFLFFIVTCTCFQIKNGLKKHKLQIEEELDFSALAIVSAAKDYKLCFQINNTLNINLDKSTVIKIWDPKNKLSISFTSYIYADKENDIVYYIVSNKEEGKIMLPKLKQVDYLCFLSGYNSSNKIVECAELLSKIASVQKVFTIESELLQNIIIE